MFQEISFTIAFQPDTPGSSSQAWRLVNSRSTTGVLITELLDSNFKVRRTKQNLVRRNKTVEVVGIAICKFACEGGKHDMI